MPPKYRERVEITSTGRDSYFREGWRGELYLVCAHNLDGKTCGAEVLAWNENNFRRYLEGDSHVDILAVGEDGYVELGVNNRLKARNLRGLEKLNLSLEGLLQIPITEKFDSFEVALNEDS